MTFGDLVIGDVFVKRDELWQCLYRKIKRGLAYDVLDGRRCTVVDDEPVQIDAVVTEYFSALSKLVMDARN